jgi:hypothetical protein
VKGAVVVVVAEHPTLNEVDAARDALAERWRQLAGYIDEAKAMQTEAQREPAKLKDPWTVALIRWQSLFDRELGAIQTVYDASSSGAKLEATDIRAARATADKLLEVIANAREQFAVPA